MSLKVYCKRILQICVFLCCFAVVTYNLYILSDNGNVLEMRLANQGITSKEASDCLADMSEEMDNVFWSEEKNSFIEDIDKTKAIDINVIYKYGNSRLLFPAVSLLIDDDEKGCLLSRKSAMELFGSDEVKGLNVTYGQNTYIIRDVIPIESEVIVINTDDNYNQYLSYVTSGIRGGNITEKKKVLQEYGGISGEEWNYELLNAALKILLALLLIILTALFRQGVNCVKEDLCEKKWLKRFFSIVMAGGIIYILAQILLICGWPAKWSDLAQWNDKLKVIINNVRFFLDSEKPLLVSLKLDVYRRTGAMYLVMVLLTVYIGITFYKE